jgi:ABC transporter substrate binding protein (PQQ-dependent alcohol dehydrogenase system)
MSLRATLFRAAVAILIGCGAAQAVDVEIVYLERQIAAPPILSNLENAPEDTGLAGARLAIDENNTTGRFLGQTYALTEIVVPEDEAFDPGAIAALEGGAKVVVAHMPAEDLLALADWPGAEGMVIFNGSARDDALRRTECRGTVLHTIPSDAMRADALAQFMLKRRWTDWLLITGEGPGDAGYADALRAAAAKFNATITGEKTWRFDADMRRNAAQEVPLWTRSATGGAMSCTTPGCRGR